MNLTPWRKPRAVSLPNYPPIFGLQHEINSLFEDWFNGDWNRSFDEVKQAYIPAIDLLKKDNCYQVKAELPGLKEDEIELFIENGQMVLKGERKSEQKKENGDYIIHESNYGSFYRTFPLPKDVDVEQECKASLKDGLLTVELPKLEDTNPRKENILIKTES